MNDRLKNAISFIGFTAALVAASPYIEFLVSPPSEKAYEWMITVIALGIVAVSAVVLHQRKQSSKG